MKTILELAARLQSAGAAEGMLWMVVKATLILAIARLLLMAMPRASAAMKHIVATATLIGVAAMPILTVFAPAWNVAVKPRPVATSTEQRPATGNKPLGTIGVSDTESDQPIVTAISVARATGIVPVEPLNAMQRATKVAGATWKGMIVVTAAVLSLLLFVHMALGVLGVWFVARRAEELTDEKALRELDEATARLGLRHQVRLLRSARISVPVVWGVFRPVLLLPADVTEWPQERLHVVLLHELAHLARYDGISLILTRIAVALFWFHPLAWSLERAGRSECERACDDLVLASGTKPSEYADHLLAIARSMPAFDPFRSVTLAMSRKSQLEGRLLSILQRDAARRVFSGRGVAIACALAVAVIVPVATLRLTATPSEEKDKAPKIAEEKVKVKSDAEVEVTPEIDAIGDYFLAKLGKYDKRADRFLRTPRNGEEWYERAYDLYHNDRYDEAAVAFRKAADAGYRKETSLYNAACSFALLGDADHALEDLDRAIDAGWDNFDHIADDSDFDPIRSDKRFAALLESRGHDIATRRVTDTVEKYNVLRREGNAEDGEDWFEVGLDLLRLRKLDESIDAFQHAIANGEKNSSAMYNIACAYALEHDAGNAMTWLEKAIDNGFSGDEKMENDPDIAFVRNDPRFDALKQKAKDLEMRGCCENDWARMVFNNWKNSVEHHRRMVEKYPDSGRAWFNLGYTALQARDFETAMSAYRKTIELNYRVGTSAYNMACAYALQGDKNAAFDWLERARKAGFKVAEHAEDDDDLDSLHRDARWDAVVR